MDLQLFFKFYQRVGLEIHTKHFEQKHTKAD